MKLDQCLCDPQAETCAFAPTRPAPIDLPKGRHRDVDLFLAHADAAVADANENATAAGTLRRDVDPAVGGRKFQSVGDDVHEDLLELRCIASDRWQVGSDNG